MLNIAIYILNLDNLIYRNIEINFVKMNFNTLNIENSKKKILLKKNYTKIDLISLNQSNERSI